MNVPHERKMEEGKRMTHQLTQSHTAERSLKSIKYFYQENGFAYRKHHGHLRIDQETAEFLPQYPNFSRTQQ